MRPKALQLNKENHPQIAQINLRNLWIRQT
jgi:hypothetical protein